MSSGLPFRLFAPVLLAAILGCERTPAPGPGEPAPASPESPARLPALETPDLQGRFNEFNQADFVFSADIAGYEQRGAMMSHPVIAFGLLRFDRIQMLKGTAPSARETIYSFQAPYRLKVQPQKGSRRVFGARSTSDKENPLEVMVCVPEDESNLALARAAVALPVGWSIDGGQPLCPWTSPALSVPGLEGSCGKCGRPQPRAGPDIDVTCERLTLVPGKTSDYYSDGIFRISVSNRGAKPAEVPALLCDDRGVRWSDSLVVVTRKQSEKGIVRILPPGPSPQGRVRPSLLAPGEVSSFTIDLFQFDLDDRVGATMDVQFALGERMCRDSFYYKNGRR